MRKNVFSAFLTALSLASLSFAASPVPAPAASAQPVAQAAPADSGKPADQASPPVSATPAPPLPVQVLQPDTAAPAVDTSAANAAKTGAVDTVQAATAVPAAADSAAADTAQAAGKPKKRKRVVRETTVNTIDELKGRYRSPKKALFMSLIVPGLGQTYVGQHWSNYARGAGYLLVDVGLLVGWNHYVNTKQDRQIKRYRRHADTYWRQSKYEDSIAVRSQTYFTVRNPHRESYCQSVQSRQGNQGAQLYQGCLDPYSASHDAFKNEHDDGGFTDSPTGIDSISQRRAEFPNVHNFYELIGKEVEFVTGWDDADNIVILDSSFTRDGKPATTEHQQEYIGMRAKANDYARMQAWFLGGMVLNHIVSALDAAYAAHVHNKSLYQTEVGWMDRLHFDSWVAWEGQVPRPAVSASLTF